MRQRADEKMRKKTEELTECGKGKYEERISGRKERSKEPERINKRRG